MCSGRKEDLKESCKKSTRQMMGGCISVHQLFRQTSNKMKTCWFSKLIKWRWRWRTKLGRWSHCADVEICVAWEELKSLTSPLSEMATNWIYFTEFFIVSNYFRENKTNSTRHVYNLETGTAPRMFHWIKNYLTEFKVHLAHIEQVPSPITQPCWLCS